jgi:hypothetical protein
MVVMAMVMEDMAIMEGTMDANIMATMADRDIMEDVIMVDIMDLIMEATGIMVTMAGMEDDMVIGIIMEDTGGIKDMDMKRNGDGINMVGNMAHGDPMDSTMVTMVDMEVKATTVDATEVIMGVLTMVDMAIMVDMGEGITVAIMVAMDIMGMDTDIMVIMEVMADTS